MRSVPVLCFVGASNSGKTTLVEKVIRALTGRGYRVATVKHTHKGFEMDLEGKDSWKHRSAGAKAVILSSPNQFAVLSDTDHELTIEDILEKFVRDADILIVEGFKRERYPKIEVHRRGVSGEWGYLNDPSVIALASDEAVDLPIPRFDLNDAAGLSNLIEQSFLKGGVS
jgi:molybdopterin-guanine dinucleotide biosynthesis protein B